MKSLALILASILLITIEVGGQDCKGIKTSIDKFSKKETKVSCVTIGKKKFITYIGLTKWSLYIIQEDGKTYIETNITESGELHQALDESTIFNILMENGEVIKMNNKGVARPLTQMHTINGKYCNFTSFLILLEPTLEQLQILSKVNISAIKVDIKSLKIKTPEISTKDAKNFKQAINCMLTTAK